MLVEFRAENHRSLREEQVLSLIASGRIEPDDSRLRFVAGLDDKLLPAIVIYGGNASGKSNVLSALSFMREAVILSHRAWEPESGVPRDPFAWGGVNSEPSLFEVTCVIAGVKYEYGFVASDVAIEEEWVNAWPSGRKQEWLVREKDKFRFGGGLLEQTSAIQLATRPNSLFLSTSAQFGNDALKPLYRFFSRMLATSRTGYSSPPMNRSPFLFAPMQPAFDFEEDVAERIRNLLVAADVGVVGVKREEYEWKMANHTIKSYRILLQHQANDEKSWLELAQESEGTQTLFRLAPMLLRALETGGVLIVDELEASLHPLLGLKILQLFNCPKTNANNSQLIFTTHDTNLLGTTLGAPALRRDQIWFTEKDTTGCTRLYPLTDFKPRNVENLERGYLQGRFGAIPFIGALTMVEED